MKLTAQLVNKRVMQLLGMRKSDDKLSSISERCWTDVNTSNKIEYNHTVRKLPQCELMLHENK